MGMGRSGSRQSPTSSNVLDLNNLSQSEYISRMQELQRAMGQTGMEAGDPDATPRRKLYVNTSKSFNINAYLLSDGKTIHSDDSDWDSLGYTERMVKNDIVKIDSGMKPMSEAVQTYRYISANGLAKMLGLPMDETQVRSMIKALDQGDQSTIKNFAKALDTDYTHKGYSSLTVDTTHTTFDSRDVRLDIKLNKGTPAIVTSNHREHEILGGRGLKYNFTKKFRVITTRTGTKQLVIDITI